MNVTVFAVGIGLLALLAATLGTLNLKRGLGGLVLVYGVLYNLTRAQQLRWATVWPQQTWAEKWGELLCPFLGRAGSPSNAMSPRPRPTSLSSDVLIQPAVWAGNWGLCPFWGECTLLGAVGYY